MPSATRHEVRLDPEVTTGVDNGRDNGGSHRDRLFVDRNIDVDDRLPILLDTNEEITKSLERARLRLSCLMS